MPATRLSMGGMRLIAVGRRWPQVGCAVTKMEHCIVFMNSWDVSDVFWSFSKCNITIPCHFPTDPSVPTPCPWAWPLVRCARTAQHK